MSNPFAYSKSDPTFSSLISISVKILDSITCIKSDNKKILLTSSISNNFSNSTFYKMEDLTGLTPDEVQNLNDSRGTSVDDLLNAVRTKFGNDWRILIDWRGFAKLADHMDRQMIHLLYPKFSEYIKEFQNLTPELTKALQGAVTKKLITITYGDIPTSETHRVFISDVMEIRIQKGMLAAEYPPDPMYNTNPANVTLWIEWHFFPARRPAETISLTSEETGYHGSSGYSHKDDDDEEDDRHSKKASKPEKKEKDDSKPVKKEKVKQKCNICKGTGKERCMQCKKGMKSSTTTCGVCKGNWEKNCHKCKGAGEV